MPHIPNRISLVHLTTEAMRANIQGGEWARHLPSERSLSKQLRVSRRTVREAICILQKEGFLKCRKNQRCHILWNENVTKTGRLQRMNFLFGEDPRSTRTFDLLYCIDEIRRHLQGEGYYLEVISAKSLEMRKPAKLLAKLAASKPADAWILFSVPVAVQQWFYTQGIPVMLLGTPDKSVKFSALEVDGHQVGYHAGNVLLSRGHRRLGCLMPAAMRMGDLAIKKSLEDAASHHRQSVEVRIEIAYYEQGASALCWSLDQLLQKRPCTGILILEAFYALTAVSYLTRKKIRVPEDVSIISLDSGDYLDFFVPEITRYVYDVSLFARKLSRMALQLCREGTLPRRSILVTPAFRAGETVAMASGS